MELVDGSPIAHTRSNGATRQIVGTHRSRERIPTLEEEPLWMRMATTAPAPAGCAMFRDIRAWHVRCRTIPSSLSAWGSACSVCS